MPLIKTSHSFIHLHLLPPYTVIETHPASTVDLRLTSPWPELTQYAQAYDIANPDAMAHSHIPFIVILLRVIEQWKAEVRKRAEKQSQYTPTR